MRPTAQRQSPPDQFFNWVAPLLEDKEELAPWHIESKITTVGAWLEGVLTEIRYESTMLPRFPVAVEREIKVQLLRRKQDKQASVAIKPGMVVRAQWSEDGMWYDARVEEPGTTPGSFWVTFLPEEEYGNQDMVSVDKIRALGDKQELLKQVVEQDRERVTSGGGAPAAAARQHRPSKRSRSRSPPPRYEEPARPAAAPAAAAMAAVSEHRKALLERYGDATAAKRD